MKTEAWMVIQKRGDGTLPDPVKMAYMPFTQGLHFTVDEAVTAKHEIALYNNLPRTYGVFRVEVEVMEEV